MWGQKAPSKHENGGKKRPQNHKVGAESAPAQIRAEKSVGAKSAVKMQKWGQKAPSKQQSDGKKRHHSNQREKVMVAESAIKMEKWWRKMPPKQQSDGRKCHYISNCGGTLTTTYHIQGAGAPAKTKNYVNADGVYIFSGKGPTFSASCKTYKQNFWKG